MKKPFWDLSCDAAGRISVHDRRTGKTWSGGRRVLTIQYADLQTARTASATAPFTRLGGSVQRGMLANGHLVLRYTIPRLGLRFEMHVRALGDSVELCLPASRLREQKQRYRLLRITPNPRWGAVPAGEEGYLLLPNRCGAICPFTVTQRVTQRALFYGRSKPSRPAGIGMPVFGVVHKHSAFLGIVTGGVFDAEHVAETRAGPRALFSTYVSFIYRHHPRDPVDPVDRSLRYFFLEDSEATYAGMAKAYRTYLLKEKKLRTMRERARQSAALRYYYSAYNDIRLNLAMKQCGHPGQRHDGHGELTVIQTFAQAKQAVQAVKEAGIDRAVFLLVGSTLEGADGLYPTKLPVEERLGGRKGLDDLIRFTRSLGFQIVNWDNYTDAYQISPDWDPDHLQKDRNGTWITPRWYWSGGLAYKICPEQGLRLARQTLPRMKALGFRGVYLCDALPVGLFPCYDPKHHHRPGRRAVAEGYRSIAALIRKTFGGCHCENFQDYMAADADAVSHVPTRAKSLDTVPPAQRPFYDAFLSRPVPFYPIAYHGIIQYHLLPYWFHEDEFLQEIEFGAAPRNNPRMGADFHGYLDWLRDGLPTMKRQYDVLCGVMGRLQFEFIENHRRPAEGIAETAYEDGTRVWVNYRGHDAACEGRRIPARGYLLEEPGGRKREGRIG